ncbi:AAA family ATPase [Desulfuromonas acetoxidans]|uniref:AAA family ATPase n=1 Tax=Desulfuromonas acetoxidans TaxID=891 RepID=UPI00292E3B72|nr:AAA family ATPase [Desulfuromonas acetoxidans]
MIRTEFLRFLQIINITAVPADVRRIANIVLQHLDELIPLSTTRGQRASRMVALAQANWDTTSSDIQPIVDHRGNQTAPITQLKSLSVGPFRGFAKQEIFNLANELVLIYGPNGTGKSSFCEALEYGLLGNVVEAESKRFRNQNDYLKNAHTDNFEAPEIVGANEQGEAVQVVASEAVYRFCFVEKNRIDSFSRIAAQAPAKQTELISTLFGLDSFTEFVRNFSPEIDGRYIDLIGAKGLGLAQKRQALVGSQEQLKSNTEELGLLDGEELRLAQKYREGIAFAQMVKELNGDEENAGLIQRLEAELQKPIAAKSGLTITALQALELSIRADLNELTNNQQELANSSQQVSFKQLYEAVSQLHPVSPNHCPACQTPLSQAVVNPYVHAGEELQKLQHLAKLQQTIQRLNETINQSLVNLSQIVNTCCDRFPTNNLLSTCRVAASASANLEWWGTLFQPMHDGFTPWQHLEVQVKQLEDADIAIDQAVQLRTTRQRELDRLRELDRQITVLATRRQTANTTVVAAQQVIDNFNTENAQLIADAEAEKAVVLGIRLLPAHTLTLLGD